MSVIEVEVLQRYQDNLNYFKSNHPELYHKLIVFSEALNQNRVQEKYALIFENNYFDVLDKKSNQYLYSQNSLVYSQNLANSISFVKNEGSIETFQSFHFPDEAAIEIDKLPLNKHKFSASATIINYVNKEAPKTTQMKIVPKFIFFGTGLGMHIPMITKRLDSPFYWIIEDDLELFRFSLFTTNYFDISKTSTILFTIMEEKEIFKKHFFTFYRSGYLDNNFLKFCIFSDIYLEKIKLIQEEVMRDEFLIFPYYKKLEKAIISPKFIAKGYNFLNITGSYMDGLFSKKPIIIVASGPSLDKNIEWLEVNHHKYIVVSVMSSLKTLKQYDIKPDIVVHIHPTIESLQFLTEGVYEWLKETPLLFAANVLEQVVNLFDKNQVYFFQQDSNSKEGFGNIVAPSVGETTVALMLSLGAKDLYLLGLDLAYNQETGDTHADNHSFKREAKQIEQDNTTLSLYDSAVQVKGNFRDIVTTSPLWRLSIDNFSILMNQYKNKDQYIYNLNDGAYLEGTIAIHPSNINIQKYQDIDYHKVSSDIKDFLSSISSNEFREVDKNILYKKLDNAYNIKVCLKSYEKRTFSSMAELEQELLKLLKNISQSGDNNNNEIRKIYLYYFYYIMGYVNSLFNTRKLKNGKRHAKKINKIFLKQLFKIVDSYIEEMEFYVNQEELYEALAS